MSTCKPLARTYSFIRHPSLLPLTQTRHESTTRRHKKLLALPESPSFTPSRPEPTLIFNPPSALPNVYHTPLKFLPPTDARRALLSTLQTSSTQSARRTHTPSISAAGTPLAAPSHLPPKPSAALPAAVRAPYEKKYHLTDKEIAEIQRLRAEDPERWSRGRLAEKFGCSEFFVGMVAKNGEKAARVEKMHQARRERWGVQRRMAREERGRRKALWGRDA